MSSANSAPQVRWLKPNENPFGVEVLDCRPYAGTMISVTADPQVAMRFGKPTTREELIQRRAPCLRKVESNLTYGLQGTPNEGPIFISQQMEDKWNVYFYDGYLYFMRSWTGDLIFYSAVHFVEGKAHITRFQTSWKGGDEDPFLVRNLDFLIKSHVFGLAALHPLPEGMKNETPLTLAVYSFSSFGRRGLYGTFEDTLGTKSYPIPTQP